MKCAMCGNNKCYDENKNCSDTKEKALDEYVDEKRKIHHVSSSIEEKYYMKKTRIEEVIVFAKSMGYKTLGIAFCIGLQNEARILSKILSKDFIVHSVCCKIGGVDKSEFDLPKLQPDEKESMCNPIGQAMELNNCNTELNLAVGLCIGHDILFNEYSEAPVSTLIVKDRVLSHNPAGALYSDYYLREAKK